MDALSIEDIQGKALAGNVAAQLELARRLYRNEENGKAFEWLRRAAATGHLEAKAMLGRRLLIDPLLDFEEGIRLTTEVAQAGNGEAVHLLAILGASGRIGAPNWPRVLQFLQRSAELGFPLARFQLALLAGDTKLSDALAAGDMPAPETWDRLRRAINIGSWLAAPGLRAVHRSPRIGVAERFASPAVCHWLIERSRPHLKRAQIDALGSGTPVYDQARTNSVADLDFGEVDVVLHLLRARMLALSGPTVLTMEGSSILHYTVGQEFLPHFDFLDPAMPGHTQQVEQFGQRVLTILIYLNEGYEGGETAFPVLGWRNKGNVGDALFFCNVDPAGKPDPLTLHAGLAPTKGEKWLLSQWVRGRAI